MLIPMKELDAKKPDISGERTKIYYLNNNLLAKKFLNLNNFKKQEIFQKYEYAKNITELEQVSLPIDILETEKGFCGYIENILPGFQNNELILFGNYCNEHKESVTLDEITSYFLKVCEIINKCHKNNIIIPDLASEGNVLFNQTNNKVYLVDYHDMQVNNIPSYVSSSFIDIDPIINSQKYYNRLIYNYNIDFYTLAIRYFYYTTHINIPKARLYKVDLESILKITQINDTHFANCIRRLYDPNIENIDISESIIELNKNYTLSKFKAGEPRIFLKRWKHLLILFKPKINYYENFF